MRTLTWGRLSDVIKKGAGLQYETVLFFVFSDRDTQLFAIELNTGSPNNSETGQLFLHGMDSEGVLLESIGGEYANRTKDIKQSEGLPFDRITLYQDGDFYRSFDFVQSKDSFKIKANTIKEGVDLQDRWGSNIVGLNAESINALNVEVLPQIVDYLLRGLLS